MTVLVYRKILRIIDIFVSRMHACKEPVQSDFKLNGRRTAEQRQQLEDSEEAKFRFFLHHFFLSHCREGENTVVVATGILWAIVRVYRFKNVNYCVEYTISKAFGG